MDQLLEQKILNLSKDTYIKCNIEFQGLKISKETLMEEWFITDFITQEETDEKNKLEYVSNLKIQQDTFQYNEESVNNETQEVELNNNKQEINSNNNESQIDNITELNNNEDTIDINNLQEEIEIISVVDDKEKKPKSTKKNDKKKKTNLIGRKKVYTL